MRTRVAFAGLALLFSACRISCKAGNAGFDSTLNAGFENTLTWDRDGFTIKLPSAWQENPERETGHQYVAVDEATGETIVITPPFAVDPPVDHSTPAALEKIAVDLEQQLSSQSPTYHRVSLKVVDVEGNPAIDWWYHVDADGLTRLRGQRLIFRGEARILASVSSPDRDSPRLQRIIESFRTVAPR
jgi:hypothetical protein